MPDPKPPPPDKAGALPAVRKAAPMFTNKFAVSKRTSAMLIVAGAIVLFLIIQFT
jgi:hypothetical protein